MKNKLLILLLNLQFLFATLVGGLSAAAEPCVEQAALLENIAKRQGTLDGIQDGLELFVKGDHSGKMPLTALFTVNLDNPSAVAKRLEELKESISTREPSPDDARTLACLPEDSEAKSAFAKLKATEKNINELRFKILSLPQEQREALFGLRKSVAADEAAIQEIVSEKELAEKRSSDSGELLKEAELQAKDAETSELRELAAARAVLEKRRKEVADLSIQRTEQLEVLTTQAKRYSEELAKDSALLMASRNSVKDDLHKGYTAVTQIWRNLVDTLFERLAEVPSMEPSSAMAQLPRAGIQSTQTSPEYEAYQQAFEQAILEEESLDKLKERIEREESAMLYGLLLNAGRLRAQFIVELQENKTSDAIPIDNEYFEDLLREIRLIPYRPVVLFKGFLLETRNSMSGGATGWLALAKSLILLLFFILFPFLVFRILQRASVSLEAFRITLINSRGQFSNAPFYALWIKRLNPYLPWIILRITTWVAYSIVEDSRIEAAAEILPYFDYFIYYRIFRLALSQLIVAGSSTHFYASRGLSPEILLRIEKTAKFIGLFFFISACLLKATEAIARQAFFYSLIWDFVLIFTPIWLATASYWWRRELADQSLEMLPQLYSVRISRLCRSRWAWFVCLPTAVCLAFVIAAKKVFIHVSRFDSAKRVSAHIFRKRVESSVKNAGHLEKVEWPSPGLDYRSYFQLDVPSDEGLFFNPENSAFPKIASAIESWSRGTSAQHTLAIQGDKGIGKSSLMRQLETRFDGLNIVKLSVPGKITSAAALYALIAEASGLDFSRPAEAIEQSRNLPKKTLILIDEAQNFFLAKRGGFAAFRAFLDLCNLRSENIFWCVTINRYAWVYLNAVTGGAQYFRHVFQIGEWNDSEIRGLIMTRHEKSGYKLEFDPIMYSLESPSDVSKGKLVEDRYFEMLWDQAKGNPRTAFILWLSALKLTGDKTLRVSLPESLPPRLLNGLTDDELFVISAIIRHENLTTREAEDVTNLSGGIVLQALRMGLDRGILQKSEDDRFRVAPLVQGSLTQALVHKNFVYG